MYVVYRENDGVKEYWSVLTLDWDADINRAMVFEFDIEAIATANFYQAKYVQVEVTIKEV